MARALKLGKEEKQKNNQKKSFPHGVSEIDIVVMCVFAVGEPVFFFGI